jgi:hypothetical protein
MSPEFNWYFSQKPSDLEKLLHTPQMKQKLSLNYIIITCHCTIIIKYDGLFISPPNIIIPGIPSQLIFFSLRAKACSPLNKPLSYHLHVLMFHDNHVFTAKMSS